MPRALTSAVAEIVGVREVSERFLADVAADRVAPLMRGEFRAVAKLHAARLSALATRCCACANQVAFHVR